MGDKGRDLGVEVTPFSSHLSRPLDHLFRTLALVLGVELLGPLLRTVHPHPIRTTPGLVDHHSPPLQTALSSSTQQPLVLLTTLQSPLVVIPTLQSPPLALYTAVPSTARQTPVQQSLVLLSALQTLMQPQALMRHVLCAARPVCHVLCTVRPVCSTSCVQRHIPCAAARPVRCCTSCVPHPACCYASSLLRTSLLIHVLLHCYTLCL